MPFGVQEARREISGSRSDWADSSVSDAGKSEEIPLVRCSVLRVASCCCELEDLRNALEEGLVTNKLEGDTAAGDECAEFGME